jgi:hypothetical protein
MADIGADEWGWFQVFGLATVKAGALTAGEGGFVYASDTPGVIQDAPLPGAMLDNAQLAVAVADGFAVISVYYPAMNGNGQIGRQ